jgi:hypothetical protein
MAFSGESAVKTRQRAYEITRSPGIFYILKAFFLHMAANKGNPDLQFLTYVAEDALGASGSVLLSGACRVYVLYGKKTATAEDAYMELFDDATNDGTIGDQRVGLPFLEASEENIFVSPAGVSFATGVVAKLYTTLAGTTDTTSGAGVNGFVIIGSA